MSKFIVINNSNYKDALNRFEILWSEVDNDSKLMDEFRALADLLSAYEDKAFPLMNDPNYSQMVREKLKDRL